MVIPLKKTTKEGKPYNRRADVELVLNELDELPPDQLVSRLGSTQQAVPNEVLVYYLRQTELALTAKQLKPIFTLFYTRLEAALRKNVSEAWLDHAAAIREEVAERVIEKIAKDRDSQKDSMYYWETNFNHALDSLITDVLREIGPARETDPLINAESLTHAGDDDDELRTEVDIAAAEFINPNPSKLDNSAFRLRLFNAINRLPEDERRAVGLFLQGMQIESQDLEVMTIAKALECTDRTVRNRLRRANEKLRLLLQAEEIS